MLLELHASLRKCARFIPCVCVSRQAGGRESSERFHLPCCTAGWRGAGSAEQDLLLFATLASNTHEQHQPASCKQDTALMQAKPQCPQEQPKQAAVLAKAHGNCIRKVHPMNATLAGGKAQVIIITGPTAVGKTGVGLDVALAVNGEVISADSVQVYKGLDVGSDKVWQKWRVCGTCVLGQTRRGVLAL
eukprot:scaffold44995_cov22-Tisochrysis_lutea.AAC.4